MKEKLINVPNILSISRVFLVPFFSYFLIKEKVIFSFLVLCTIVLTDALDGFIARFFSNETKIGKILDHVIDKFVIAWIMITLSYLRDFPLWGTFLVIGRDFLSLLAGVYILRKNRLFGSNIFGKISGFFFAITTLLFLFSSKVRFIFFYLTIISFFVASITYSIKFVRNLQPKKF